MSRLSGLSPLLGEDDNETLANVTAAEWDFDDESFDVISDEAKDFIGQLLVKNGRYVQGQKMNCNYGPLYESVGILELNFSCWRQPNA